MTLFTFYKRVPFSSTQAPSVTARGSMTSRSISHYRLIKKLGAGGMGEVYLAKDARLDREVAIKLLSSQATSDEHARKRLIREAKAAAKLDHPNICSVYAVEEQGDQSFIVMQYVEGETLASRIQRQPLALKEALHIAVQMADALAEAHSRAIIHRDIKPANMMLTARGQLKVMDFGLAKVVPEKPVAVSEVPTESLLTEPGMIIGTVPYMSPEQVRGEPLDPRTDIFSFGAVLYELISGRRPFAAEDRATILSAILTQEPLPLARYAPDTPDELQRIVRKCLVKNREHRYQSARDLLIDLKNLQEDGESAFRPARQAAPQRRGKAYRIAIVAIAIVILALARLAVDRLTAPTRAIDSIAVLPFENRSPDADTEYLSDGLAESLIYRLSQLPDLKVSPTSSAFRYKGKGADAQTVGNDLGVQAVMTGRIAQRGEQLTISVELVEVRNNKLLWGEQYERKLSELLAMQREMAAEITDKLRLKLSGEGERKLAKTYTDNNEAYQLYLKGRYFWDKRTPEGMDKARQSFNQAIDIDPNYALAYAGLADTFLFCTCPLPRDETMPKARAYAERALAIDESLAEAHTSLVLQL